MELHIYVDNPNTRNVNRSNNNLRNNRVELIRNGKNIYIYVFKIYHKCKL